MTIAQGLAFTFFVLQVSQASAFCSAPPADTTTLSATPRLAGEGAIQLTQREVTGPYQFGLVRAGATVHHDFTLWNDTKQPLQLDRVAPSCHCTSAFVLPEKPSTKASRTNLLAPGQSIQVRVTLDTSQIAASETDPEGQVQKIVSVYVVGQPVHPAAVLTLSGRIAASAAFDPPLLDLGAISSDQVKRRKVRLFFASTDARLAAVGDDRLRLQRLGVTHASSGDVQIYQVEVPAHADAGPLSAAVAVVGDKATTATLPVTGQINGSVSSSPPSIIFGVVPAEATASLDTAHRTRSISLSNSNLHPADAAAFWAHTTITLSPNSFWQAGLVTQELPSSTSRQLRVVLNAAAPAGQWLTGRAIVSFPDGTRLIIPVAGENAPLVAADPPAANLPGAAPATTPTVKAVHP